MKGRRTALGACRCSELGEECPACAARIARYTDGPVERSQTEWDRWEQGPGFHYPPGWTT